MKKEDQIAVKKTRLKRNIFCFMIFFYFSIPTLLAQKNDTIYLLNGDKITGEIKKFEYGLLYLKTDAMLSVTIPYDRINTIHSAKLYELIETSGKKYFGSILRSKDRASIIIVLNAKDSIEKPIINIVKIAYLKNTFFQRMDGSISFGLNFTKASDVLQFNINTWVTHRIKNYLTRVDVNSLFTNENEGVITKNNDFGISLTRYLPKKWFIKVQEKFQQNTELDLKQRFQSGLGPGYDFLRTNKMRLYGLTGLIYNFEETIEDDLSSNNLEALFSVQYRWVKYMHPKVDVTSGINYFPSITIKDRYRLEFNLVAKFEIITDLFFSINFYDTFDSHNISTGKEKNDYGIINSISFTF